METMFNQMPNPPQMGYGYAVDQYGNRVQAEYYPPQYQAPIQQPQAQSYQPNSLGVNFGSLIGSNVVVPVDNGPAVPADTSSKPKRKRKSKNSDGEEPTALSTKLDNIQMVEETNYEDTYQFTTTMLRGVIAQADELAGDLKAEINRIRSTNNMKGKYTYLANLSSAAGGLLSTKVTAIREINSSIKAANDANYRRYKDFSAAEAQDDSKMIMDMYNAYIKTPVGSIPGIQYSQPSSFDITASTGNIMRVDAAPADARDAGFNNYLANLTPEQNAMIHEGNPNIEEVIVYDQASGKKYFEWRDLTTGQKIPNMPQTDPSFLEDYTINPHTRTAKNINLHSTMKVIYENEGVLNQY